MDQIKINNKRHYDALNAVDTYIANGGKVQVLDYGLQRDVKSTAPKPKRFIAADKQARDLK